MLGDALQQRGDPQGELIALQLSLEGLPPAALPVRRRVIERRIAAVLDRHHDALYGALAPHVMRTSLPDVLYPALGVTRWRSGFADAIWLRTTCRSQFATTSRMLGVQPEVALADVYRAMRSRPIASFVRDLVLGMGDHARAVAELTTDPPPTLRSLTIGDWSHYSSMLENTSLPNTGVDLTSAKQLETLRFEYATPFVPFGSPTLRCLTLYQPVVAAAEFAGARLPMLEQLTIGGFRIDRGLFDRYPTLREANLNGTVDDGWLERFLRSSNVHRVRTLRLGSDLRDDDLAALARNLDRVTRLELLELRGRFSPQVMVAAERGLPPNVTIIPV